MLLIGISAAHLQQVAYCDLFFSWIFDFAGELGKEIHHLLVQAPIAAVVQRDPDERRCETLGRRLPSRDLVDGPSLKYFSAMR